MKHASFSERKAVRLAAARLFEQGHYPISEIGRILGVSGSTIFRWYKLWREGGVEGLKHRSTGYKRRVNEEQLKQIEQELLKGACAHGYETNIWTLERIAALIEELTGVRYCTGHVWLILTQMGWSCQKAERTAKQRDEEAIRNWLAKEWPAIKRGRKSK